MNLLDRASLGNTIDNVSEALLFGFDISGKEKSAIAGFLTERHFAAGAYANMFAPTDLDVNQKRFQNNNRHFHINYQNKHSGNSR